MKKTILAGLLILAVVIGRVGSAHAKNPELTGRMDGVTVTTTDTGIIINSVGELSEETVEAIIQSNLPSDFQDAQYWGYNYNYQYQYYVNPYTNQYHYQYQYQYRYW